MSTSGGCAGRPGGSTPDLGPVPADPGCCGGTEGAALWRSLWAGARWCRRSSGSPVAPSAGRFIAPLRGGGRGGAPTHGALLHLSKSSCARRAPRAAWRVATLSVRLRAPRPARAKARNARRAPSFRRSGSLAHRWVSRRRWPRCPGCLYRTSVRKSSPCPRGGPAVAALRRSVLPGSRIPAHAAAGADPLLTGAMLGPLLQHPAVPDGRGGPVCPRPAPSGLPWTRELLGSLGEEKSARDVPPAVGRACNGT